MSKITYNKFKKLEKTRFGESGNTDPKYDEEEFVLNLLEERPYQLSEIKNYANNAELAFEGNEIAGYGPNILDAIRKLTKEGRIESRYGLKGEIYYGLTKEMLKKSNPE